MVRVWVQFVVSVILVFGIGLGQDLSSRLGLLLGLLLCLK